MPKTKKDPIVAMQENIRYLRSQKASREDIEAEIARWQPIIARYNATEQEQAEREEKLASPVTRVATAFGQVPKALPGGEAAMAGLRSVVRRQPYAEALEDIRTAQESINPVAGAVTRGAASMAALGPVLGRIAPATTAAGGALQAAGTGAGVSAIERALSATPESMAERASGTVKAAKRGAAFGAGLQLSSRAAMGLRDVGKSLLAPSRGAQQQASDIALAAQTKPMYEAAEAAGRVTQGPAQTFGQPGIREYVDDILSSPSFREKYPNPSQQDIIKAVREHIIDTQEAAVKAAASQAATGGQRVQAATRLKQDDAEVLARRLLQESDYFTQGAYRQAVTATRAGKEVQRAAQDVAETVRTAANRPWVSGQKLASKSLEAGIKNIQELSPEQARAALPAAYAGLRESIVPTPSFNPFTLFGITPSAMRAVQARPAIQAIEQVVASQRAPGLGQTYQALTPKTLRDYMLGLDVGLRP